MPRDLNHPVWEVYDLLRTARLNSKYYSGRIARLQRQQFWLDALVAAAASGSALASLPIWSTSFGRPAWQAFAIPAAVASVVKPSLNLSKRIRALEEVATAYRVFEAELRGIELTIRTRKAYDPVTRTHFEHVLGRLKELALKPAEAKEDTKLKRRCQEEVKRELPSTHFFVPEEGK